MDEGYIKYTCEWIKADPLPDVDLKELIHWRQKLYALHLIGAYPNAIGFGNISVRSQHNQFVISGSATGNFSILDGNHFTLVDAFNLSENSLRCVGPIKASSESLSHAVFYNELPDCNAVIHVHHLDLWKGLLNNVPTTHENIPYGTPEMALEINRLLEIPANRSQQIIAMGGHEEGVISFGANLEEAGEILLRHLFECEK